MAGYHQEIHVRTACDEKCGKCCKYLFLRTAPRGWGIFGIQNIETLGSPLKFQLHSNWNAWVPQVVSNNRYTCMIYIVKIIQMIQKGIPLCQRLRFPKGMRRTVSSDLIYLVMHRHRKFIDSLLFYQQLHYIQNRWMHYVTKSREKDYFRVACFHLNRLEWSITEVCLSTLSVAALHTGLGVYKTRPFGTRFGDIWIKRQYLKMLQNAGYLSWVVVLKPESQSKSFPPMPWLLASPDPQHWWNWLCTINESLSSTRKDFNYQHYLKVKKIYKKQTIFLSFLKS